MGPPFTAGASAKTPPIDHRNPKVLEGEGSQGHPQRHAGARQIGVHCVRDSARDSHGPVQHDPHLGRLSAAAQTTTTALSWSTHRACSLPSAVRNTSHAFTRVCSILWAFFDRQTNLSTKFGKTENLRSAAQMEGAIQNPSFCTIPG